MTPAGSNGAGTVGDPTLHHLLALTDRFGTYEHADGTRARPEHGYCTDDVARVVVLIAGDPAPSRAALELGRTSLRFVADAQNAVGEVRNRRSSNGRWLDRHGVEDAWGRSVWAFGSAAVPAARPPDPAALAYFEHGATQRSPWPRAMAFAALGAAAVVSLHPWHRRARALLDAAVPTIGHRQADASWPWPEDRLTYANAVLPDAMLAIGHALGRAELIDDGLALLGWLLDRQSVAGHLSVTPAGGEGHDGAATGVDQQPIEVATLAAACGRAFDLTGDTRWSDAVASARGWFDGANDSRTRMWDPATSGGYDGLEPDGANQNQGAESTLALLATVQQARRLASVTG